MPLKRLQIFISSPGDVAEERVIANNLVRRLSDEFVERLWIEPVFWEHEPLLATETFQKQLPPPHDCEVVICILWSRLGTRLPADIVRPDGSTYASGTEYEFEDAADCFRRTGQPKLLVYRKRADPLVSLKDTKALMERVRQKESLDQFIEKWFINEADGTLKAAYHSFTMAADFESLLEEHLRKLIDQRLPPQESSAGHSKPTWTDGSPFRGLEVFEFEHAPIFFGRTRATSDVLNALRVNASAGCGFVLVVGISGGGKSSLVRAGVLPLLVQPGVIEGVGLWRWAILKPSDADGNLFLSLADALLAVHAIPELASDGTNVTGLAELLRKSPAGAFALIKGGLSQAAAAMVREQSLTQQPEARLAIVVDQLEELFTTANVTPADRQAFLSAISALARSGKVWVIGTLRGDFYHRTFEIPELVAMQDGAGQYTLPLPTPAELGQMIRRPAQAAGLSFEEDPQNNVTLDELLRDAATVSPEALPLLQFTLTELYHRRDANGQLLFSAYNELGGLEGALTSRAEEAFGILPASVQSSLSQTLRSLISVDEAGAASRKQADLRSLSEDPGSSVLVNAFVRARLLSVDAGPNESPTVQLAHEALLRRWPRLVEWLVHDRELLRIRDRVTLSGNRWERDGFRSDLLLPAGKPLDEACILLAEPGLKISSTVVEFIQASTVKARQRRQLQRFAIAALAFLAIAAGCAALYANRQRRTVVAQQVEISRSLDHAKELLADIYAKRAAGFAESNDLSMAALWYAKALETLPPNSNSETSFRIAVGSTLRETTHLLDMDPTPLLTYANMRSYDPATNITTANPHELVEKTVTEGSRAGLRPELFNRTMEVQLDGENVTTPLRHESMIAHDTLSPDNHQIVTMTDSEISRVWDITSNQPMALPIDNIDDGPKIWDIKARSSLPLKNVAHLEFDDHLKTEFSPDGTHFLESYGHFSANGRSVLAVDNGGTVVVWDSSTGDPIKQLHHEADVTWAGFRPYSTSVATACGNQIRIWDLSSDGPFHLLLNMASKIDGLEFSPNGKYIAVATQGGHISIVDADSGKDLCPPFEHRHLNGIGFSPDGKLLASVGGNTAQIWNASTGASVTGLLWCRQDVGAFTFDPKSKYFATAGGHRIGDVARVWNITSGQLTEFGKDCDTVEFSPDGACLLTTDEDSATLWSAATGERLTPPLPRDSRIEDAHINPDGKSFLTVGQDRLIQQWDITPDPRPAADLSKLAELLSAQQIDDQGVSRPISPDEWKTRWDYLRHKYPQEFRPQFLVHRTPTTRPGF